MNLEKLYEYLDSVANIHFEYGKHDCLTFTSTCLDVMGVEFDKAKLPKYKTELGAKKALVKMGGMESAITSIIGEPLPNLLTVQRGDVCLTNQEGLAICAGVSFYGPGPKGLEMTHIDNIKKAWSCQRL